VVSWGTVTGEGGKGFAKELGKGQEMGKLEEVKDERNIRQPVFFRKLEVAAVWHMTIGCYLAITKRALPD